MTRQFHHRTFTPDVRSAQERYYGRSQAQPPSMQGDRLGSNERAFIESRDSFYIATVNQDGWPYLQHRGGPAGFLKVLGPDELAFADFGGNRQLLTTGNLQGDGRLCLFLMSYPMQTRLKILGHATVVSAGEAPSLAGKLVPAGSADTPERLFRIRVEAFDWNCPQFITPRFTEEEIAEAVLPLKARITLLEEELRRLKGQMG